MSSRAPWISGSAVTLMIQLMAAMGLLLTFSHLALRLSDSITMHVREERMRGAVMAQALAAGAHGAVSTPSRATLRYLAQEAQKSLDSPEVDLVKPSGEILLSTTPAHEKTKLSVARLTFSESDVSLSAVSYTGPTRYEAASVLHGPRGPEGYLVLSFQSDAVARAVASELSTDVVIGIIWLALLVVLSVPLIRHLTKPLTRLAAQVSALKEGAYSTIAPMPTAIREVAILQERFAHLAGALEVKERENQSLLDRLRHQVEVVTRDLEHTNVFLRSVVKSLRSALVTTDKSGLVTSASERTPAVLGKPLELGRPLVEQLAQEKQVSPAFARVLEGAPQARVELKPTPSRFLDLQMMPLEDTQGERLGVLARIEDVSDQKKLEVQVARAERLSTVGEIAAGFAHEFGNSMHVVLGLGKVLLSELPPDAPGRSDIAAMVKESEQAAALVGRFKMFASPSRGKLLPVDLESVVREAAQVLDKEMRRHNVKFECDAARDAPEINGDPALLRQAVLNLFLNAVQAMPKGGDLFARIARTPAGGTVLTVRDTGTGIKPEDIARIFDPFFTTKREGEGTGLGLSVVQTVVTLHGATIDVESEPGKGTTFELAFPDSSGNELEAKS